MIATLLVVVAVGQQVPSGYAPPPPVHVVGGQAPQVIARAPGGELPPHGYLHHGESGFVLPPGPGLGWGFPNDAPDGYGWYGVGNNLPLGADRTPEYNFPRYFSVPPQTMFFPTYYNKYTTRGQRYIPFTGCGGDVHPASAPVIGLSTTPVTPYSDQARNTPVTAVPTFGGQVEAAPTTPGETDLIP
jgi:hypothetical protein